MPSPCCVCAGADAVRANVLPPAPLEAPLPPPPAAPVPTPAAAPSPVVPPPTALPVPPVMGVVGTNSDSEDHIGPARRRRRYAPPASPNADDEGGAGHPAATSEPGPSTAAPSVPAPPRLVHEAELQAAREQLRLHGRRSRARRGRPGHQSSAADAPPIELLQLLRASSAAPDTSLDSGASSSPGTGVRPLFARRKTGAIA